MNGRVVNRRGWMLLIGGLLAATSAAAGQPTFEVTLSETIRGEPVTGRVYVFTSRRDNEPRTGPDWFNPEPFLARDVVDWPPSQPLTLAPDDPHVLTFPKDFRGVNLTGSRAQAVVRLNPFEREVGEGQGNGFSQVSLVPEVVPENGSIALTVDELVEPRPFVPTKWSRLLTVRSRLLSEFHGRNVIMKASVSLPASYFADPDQRYPTIYNIPGFGGTHRLGRRDSPVPEENERGVEFLRVVLDPSCPLGHHVFANSANNGPVGDALVEELIPAFERQFRSIADSQARFLTGHSSGGWSSLWLQIAYPETFGGVWSTAPDPVDFRDFQRIDLYEPGANLYVDDRKNRRPLAIKNGHVAAWYADFAWMEHVLGSGGQLHSFEAVFSPGGDDGRPRPLWNRETGLVDADVARSWEPYDIRLILEQHWNTLGPKLAGKLHVFTGSADTFLLDGAVRLLKESLERLGSDAVVEIHEGRDHKTLLDQPLRGRIRREMTATFLEAFPDWQPPQPSRSG